jgi:hypothetical protein
MLAAFFLPLLLSYIIVGQICISRRSQNGIQINRISFRPVAILNPEIIGLPKGYFVIKDYIWYIH